MAAVAGFCRPLTTGRSLTAMLALMLFFASCSAFKTPSRTRDTGPLRVLLNSVRCGEAPPADRLLSCSSQ